MPTPRGTPEAQGSAPPIREPLRLAAAGLSIAVAALYLLLFVLVLRIESRPGADAENTFGAYLFLAVPYLAGTALLLRGGRRRLWITGALVQVAVLVLFVLFGVGLFGPGVFEYEALDELPIEAFAIVLTAAQCALLVMLGVLGVSAHRR